MPQSVKLSISAAVDKGPTVKGESTFDITTYGAVVEETVCKCGSLTVDLPPFSKNNLEFVLVTADKFSADMNCPPTMPGVTPPCKKYITYSFPTADGGAAAKAGNPCAPVPVAVLPVPQNGMCVGTPYNLQYPTLIPMSQLPSA